MPDGSLVGSLLELEIGAVAHGGSCIARIDGRVVFVRHALPGETVRAIVTEDRHGSYLRADAVEILSAHQQRVPPPCPYAGPGRCGGCDWQHADGPLQRQLKRDIIHEQFRRLAGTDVSHLLSQVEELPTGTARSDADGSDADLLGWRTRITYAVGGDGLLGLHQHRSTRVQRVERCLIGVAGVGDADLLGESWRGVSGVEVVRGDDGACTVLEHRPGPGRQARGRRPPDRVSVASGPDRVAVSVLGHAMTVAAGGFWQVHPAAADAYARTVLDLVRPAAGEFVLELFSGAGAFTVPLAIAVGPTGRVLAIESSGAAVEDARANLAGHSQAQVRRARVDATLLTGLDARPDVVVLDPPRAGLGVEAMTALLALRPRAIGYVSCDPASLARDVRVALDAPPTDGAVWRLDALRAFDAFPMTAHIECIALLVSAERDEP